MISMAIEAVSTRCILLLDYPMRFRSWHRPSRVDAFLSHPLSTSLFLHFQLDLYSPRHLLFSQYSTYLTSYLRLLTSSHNFFPSSRLTLLNSLIVIGSIVFIGLHTSFFPQYIIHPFLKNYPPTLSFEERARLARLSSRCVRPSSTSIPFNTSFTQSRQPQTNLQPTSKTSPRLFGGSCFLSLDCSPSLLVIVR